MITVNNIYDQICDYENIELAYRLASYCKQYHPDFLKFNFNLPYELASIKHDLDFCTYEVGKYSYFTVYDPKEREIMKLPPRDRVIQHAWNNIVSPIFDRKFIYHSYACRPFKGLHVATKELHDWIYTEAVAKGNCVYALKCDIHQYFKSINHYILKTEIMKYISDTKVLYLTFKFIDANGKMPNGVGIPVGNLSSQLFANIYGNKLDKFIKNELHIHYYMRYVDDFIILDSDYHVLEELKFIIEDFLNREMYMSLNPKSTILYADNGIDFIGFVHYPEHIAARKSTIQKIDDYITDFENHKIPLDEFYISIPSRLGFIENVCDEYKYIKNVRSRISRYLEDSVLDKDYSDFFIRDCLGGYYNEIYCKGK